MEECVFRAVPLALGALIGARFGRRTLGIGDRVRAAGGDLRRRARELPRLSAVLAAGRAGRAVAALGGDLPALRSAADHPAARGVRPRAVLDSAVPGRCAGRVGAARRGVRRGARAARRGAVAPGAGRRLGRACRRRSATADGSRRAPRSGATGRRPASSRVARGRIARPARAAACLASAGLAAWFACDAACRPTCRRSPLDRAAAEAAADAALKARGVTLGPEWRRFSTVRRASDEPIVDAAQVRLARGGRRAYRALSARRSRRRCGRCATRRSKATSPRAPRNGASRSSRDGRVRQFRHVLPEARPGARLPKDAALAARGAASARAASASDPAALTQVAAEEKDRPARTDWSFMFADPRVDVGKGGEARMSVTLAGDEIVGAGRFVHVPEAWLRARARARGPPAGRARSPARSCSRSPGSRRWSSA